MIMCDLYMVVAGPAAGEQCSPLRVCGGRARGGGYRGGGFMVHVMVAYDLHRRARLSRWRCVYTFYDSIRFV